MSAPGLLDLYRLAAADATDPEEIIVNLSSRRLNPPELEQILAKAESAHGDICQALFLALLQEGLVDQTHVEERLLGSLERVAIAITGLYEYDCTPHPGSVFEDDESLHGGRLFLDAWPEAGRIHVRVFGERWWFARATVQQKLDLSTPVVWEATGQLGTESHHLYFSYTFHRNGQTGETVDQFILPPEAMHLLPGKFRHVKTDGTSIAGDVRLKRVPGANSLSWAPEGLDLSHEEFPPLEAVDSRAARLTQSLPSTFVDENFGQTFLIDAVTGNYELLGERDLVNAMDSLTERYPGAILLVSRVGMADGGRVGASQCHLSTEPSKMV